MSKRVFERVEKKYLLNPAQLSALREQLSGKMCEDCFGRYTISNLYYDTDTYELIRHSLEKPVYKEKLRLRCYGKASHNTDVFIELKKKYKGVVYKRRETLPYSAALAFLSGSSVDASSQILREINAFRERYNVSPRVFLCYDRTALAGVDDPELRLTFDTNVRFRQTELRLDNGTFGTDILPAGCTLMELKANGAIPLWLSQILSELQIFPTSFSKYGVCYTNFILPSLISSREVATSA